MLFNSLAFVLFLAAVLPLAHRVHGRAQTALLLVASYVFYGWWDWRFCGLLLLSTVVDYYAARWIEDGRTAGRGPRSGRMAVAFSLIVNLGVLCFFKYFNFFIDSFLTMTASVGLAPSESLVRVALPIGISFYTFQTLGYTIDVYRGKLGAVRDPLVFGLYVAFFPQLVAGPIERANRLLPQLQGERTLTPEYLRTGVSLLLVGWFKKVGLADGVAPYVDEVFADPGSYSSASIVLGTQLFLIQLYGDFSGYSDMARGTARLLGVDLMLNFRRPYLTPNIAHFWRNWHVSLSSWFMDYLYLPLGGSRKGTLRNFLNLFLVFSVSGAWHGAGWNFVLWGWVNVALVWIYRLWSHLPFNQKIQVPTASLRWFVGVFITTEAFGLSMLFFRSESIAGVWTTLWALVKNPVWLGLEWPFAIAFVLYAVPMYWIDVLQFRSGSEEPWLAWPTVPQGVLLGCGVLWILVLGGVDVEVPFIYFQF